MFLFHHNQSGGSRMNQQLPLNILKRSPITYFRVNFNQHKDFYNFFEQSIVDDFIDVVYVHFIPSGEDKVQGYAEIINQQQGEIIVSENWKVWLINVYTGKYLNPYVRCAVKNDILKRVISNGETGSSWTFKRFRGCK